MTLGIDLSLTNTGIGQVMNSRVIARGYQAQAWSVLQGSEVGIDAQLFKAVEKIRAEYYHLKSALIAVEGLSYGSNLPSAQERAALHYMVRRSLIDDERPFIIVPPTTLKKFVCGTGNAKKELVLKEIYRRFGVDVSDNNQADALGLAFFAMAYCGDLRDMAKDQEAVLLRYKQMEQEKLAKLTPKPKKTKR